MFSCTSRLALACLSIVPSVTVSLPAAERGQRCAEALAIIGVPRVPLRSASRERSPSDRLRPSATGTDALNRRKVGAVGHQTIFV